MVAVLPKTSATQMSLIIPFLALSMHFCQISAITTNVLYGESSILNQRSTCADTSYLQRPQAGLPSNFCCPRGQVCIPLAANTTVLCYPGGGKRSTIQPVTCDIAEQNSTLHPGSTRQTATINSQLISCGNACCPFGYSCNTNGHCNFNTNQDLAPPSSITVCCLT